MDYLDFELEIGTGQGRHFPLRVLRSPAGEARETMHFPHDDLALDNRLQAIEIELLRSSAARRRLPSAREHAAETFGSELFEALLSGAVRNRWEVSRREAERRGLGLRLKLRVASAELAALPWEFLHDPETGEYLGLSRSTPVVRYLELARPTAPLTVTPPLRILAMVAAPPDLELLDIDRERDRIEMALSHLRDDGTVQVHWLDGQDWRSLQRAMRAGPWHVFHFIGHGGFDRTVDEGVVALVGRDGHSRRVTATQLARLLADHRSLRLVLLNACEAGRSGGRDVFSSTSSILVRRGIPAVVAMQYEITDRAAIEFCRGFYEAVGDGLPIDDAVTEARKAVSFAIDDTVEWATPVLHMHAPDGVLFDLQATPAGDAAEAGPGPGGPETRKAPTASTPSPPDDVADGGVQDAAVPIPSPGDEASGTTDPAGAGVRVVHGHGEVTGVVTEPDSAEVQVEVRVVDGALDRRAPVRVLRDGTTVVTDEPGGFTRHDLSMDRCSEGNDCVVSIPEYDRPRPGDVVESFEVLTDGSQRTTDGDTAAIEHGGHQVVLTTWPSPEEVVHDGHVVSTHSSWTLRSRPHEFDVEEDGQHVHYEIRTGLRWNLGWWWEVRRNGHLVHSDR